MDLDRLDEAEDILVEATTATDRLGSVTSVMVWHMLAMCRERRGDLVGALAAMRRYVTAVTASRDMQVHSTAAVNAARLRREEVERERDVLAADLGARAPPGAGRPADRHRVPPRVHRRHDRPREGRLPARAGHRRPRPLQGRQRPVRPRGRRRGARARGRGHAATVAASAPAPARASYRVGGEEFVLAFTVDGLDDAALVGAVERPHGPVAGVDLSDIPLPVREDSPG